MNRAWLFIVVFVLGAFATPPPVESASRCSLEDYDASERPDPTKPTDVTIGLFVVDLVAVDDVEQSFTADLIAWLAWEDPRLTIAVEGSGLTRCRFPVGDVWYPEIVLFNRREFSRQLGDFVQVDVRGRVRYMQRYQGTLRASLDLRDFPLDRQVLPITAVSTEYGTHELNLRFDLDAPRNPGDFSLSGWNVEGESSRVGMLDTARSDSATVGEQFARFDYDFRVRRDIGFYVWRAILPLTFIVMMSWAVFWIDPGMAGVQIGLAATSVLTVIAFGFSLNAILPRLSYLTRMDLFLFASLALVFAAFVEAVATAVLSASKREKLAVRLDRGARGAFPAIFALVQFILWNVG